MSEQRDRRWPWRYSRRERRMRGFLRPFNATQKLIRPRWEIVARGKAARQAAAVVSCRWVPWTSLSRPTIRPLCVARKVERPSALRRNCRRACSPRSREV
jgi:hypothetical protein